MAVYTVKHLSCRKESTWIIKREHFEKIQFYWKSLQILFLYVRAKQTVTS